jgi:hypothetical protein
VVPRSGRDGKRNAMRQWKQSGHRSGKTKVHTKGGPRPWLGPGSADFKKEMFANNSNNVNILQAVARVGP